MFFGLEEKFQMMNLIFRLLKKFFIVVCLFFLFIFFIFVSDRIDNYATFSWESQIRWGDEVFNSKKFQKYSINKKSKMVSDIIRKDYFIGQTREQVMEVLGQRNGGYYNDDIHLTYRIYEDEHTTWDLVLLVDYKTRTIDKVFAYRQYGGTTRTILYFFIGLIGKLF